MRTYKGYINDLPENGIFGFGSNPLGINGNPVKRTGGAALFALEKGWIKQGEKLDNCLASSGKAWGFTTVTGPGKKRSKTPREICEGIEKAFKYLHEHPEKEMYVAYTDDGKPNLNGYTTWEMAMIFSMASSMPNNIIFEERFAKLVQKNINANVLQSIKNLNFKTEAYYTYPTGTVGTSYVIDYDSQPDAKRNEEEELLYKVIHKTFTETAERLDIRRDNKTAIKIIINNTNKVVYLSSYDWKHAVCYEIDTNRGGKEIIISETIDPSKITWHDKQHELLERDPEERMEVYICVGTDEEGNEYQGNAYYFADMFDSIKNIEKV